MTRDKVYPETSRAPLVFLSCLPTVPETHEHLIEYPTVLPTTFDLGVFIIAQATVIFIIPIDLRPTPPIGCMINFHPNPDLRLVQTNLLCILTNHIFSYWPFWTTSNGLN